MSRQPGRFEVARAIAFFETFDDTALMRGLLAKAAPRARRSVGRYLRQEGEHRVPPPADLRPAPEPASREEALATFDALDDFALLQALTRVIGRRVEELEGRA